MSIITISIFIAEIDVIIIFWSSFDKGKLR